MKKIHLIISLLLFTLYFQSSYSQVSSDVALMSRTLPREIATPTTSTLGLYGNQPVSCSSGRVDVSIPLFSTAVRDIPLNITLDYNTSGVLVNSLPGWTGQNWVLNAGGVIKRTVNNVPDEVEPATNKNFFANYFHSYDTFVSIKCDSIKVRNLSMYPLYTTVEHDFSPDVFTFNFMGMSGRFFLGNDGEWKVDSDWNIDVEFDVKDNSNYARPVITKMANSNYQQPKTIRGFRLRDENGTVYEFGNMTSRDETDDFCNATEYSCNLMPMLDADAERLIIANAWYLRNVKDRFGNLLYEFSYQRGCFMAQFYNHYERYIYDGSGCWKTLSHRDTNNSSFPFVATLNLPVYLSRISCGNGIVINFNSNAGISEENFYNDDKIRDSGLMASSSTVMPRNPYQPYEDFFYPYSYLQTDIKDIAKYQFQPGRKNRLTSPLASAAIKQLESISIKWKRETGDENVKMFKFCYSNFPRFFLNNIEELASTVTGGVSKTQQISKYKFVYNDGEKLPGNYATTAADHWGYFNDHEYTLTDCNGADFYNLRNPNAKTMQYGSLRSITYPTGGMTVFEYEPHDYSNYISDTRDKLIAEKGTAGGLRIKRITDYEDESCNVVLSSRTYSYAVNGKSSGVLYSKPKYFWPKWSLKVMNGGALESASMAVFRSSSIIPLANLTHPHVMYSQVEEKNADGSRIVYKYTDDWVGRNRDEGFFLKFHESATSPYDRFSEKYFARGKLKEKTLFDKDGKLLCTEIYKDTLCNDTHTDYIVSSGTIQLVNNILVGGLYRLYYQKSRPALMTKSVHTTSGILREVYACRSKKFELNMISPYSHKSQAFLTETERKTRQKLSVEKSFAYTVESNDSVLRNYSLSAFYLCPNIEKIYNNDCFTKKVETSFIKLNRGESVFVVPHRTTVTYPQNVSEEIVSYTDYTDTGQLHLYKRIGEPSTLLIWGMNDNYLMIKCQNLYNISGNPFEGKNIFDEDETFSIQTQFRKKHSNALVTSYTYSPINGITSVTDPAGQTTYYEYAPDMRLSGILNNKRKPLQRYEYNYRNK